MIKLILSFFYVISNLLNVCFAQNPELTYIGALKSGSPDGLVPSWEGGLKNPPKNWSFEKGLIDPFAEDKIIDIIDYKKISKYKNFLSLGLKKLLNQNRNFQIYRSHSFKFSYVL